MTRVKAITAIRQIEPALRERGATSLHIFGSRVRGDAQSDSDLDVFIEYDPDSNFSLIDLVHLGSLIEDHTGVRVDIITRESIKPFLRDEIESSAVRVF